MKVMHCTVLLLLAAAPLLLARISMPTKCAVYHNGCEYELAFTPTQCNYAADEPALVSAPNKKEAKDEEDVTVKQLQEMDKKLSKMLEGLSVRSLRHIRQIRTDISQLSSTISLLQSPKRGKRGELRRLELTCPDDFLRLGTWPSCYRLSNFNSTWADAREYCSAFGANLLALETMTETYIVDYLIRSTPEFEDAKGWWTSGNYVVKDNKWMWASKHHLKEMAYLRWDKGEPDARSTMHCLLMYKHAGYRWHDGFCSDKHNFICEIDLASLQ